MPGGWKQGGWFALPNLRGGGEYGENWHEQGMFEKKQNVFDDWFAAAEYLIAISTPSPQRFCHHGQIEMAVWLMGLPSPSGRSCFRPYCGGYPLLDMLRYQKFLVGLLLDDGVRSAENEKQFPYLLKYSP